MKTVNLDGKWKLDFSGKIYEATVPGLDIIDLINSGDICEPNEAEKDTLYFYISENDKTYSRSFNLKNKDPEAKKIELCFQRLDTLATVYINGQVVASTNNIHLSYCFDIKNYIHEGENTIEIIFESLRKHIKEKQSVYKLPHNSNGTAGHPHIRKAACHFGWDFAPELDVQGISGHCEIRIRNHSLISDMKLSQKTFNNVGIIEGALNFTEEITSGKVEVTLFSPDGSEQKTIINPKESTAFSFEVNSPEIWWCNGLGNQPLYKVEAVYKVNSRPVSTLSKRIGFREIKLDTSPDRYGTNFQFIINGKVFFAKGANYIPMDALYTRITKERLYSLLLECKNANMNMIRVWGGGFYESNDFYDICDELGILVWQDFAFACCAYPFMQNDFLSNIEKEVEYNVKRLMHHPCLALWCGNNEIESMSLAWINRADIITSTDKFFYETLPELVRKYDPVTPYHACSPSSGKYMKDVNSDDYGDTHIWNVWHGYQQKEYFKKRFTRFASEFGMQSYPNEGVIPHQKCDLGEERLNYYLSTLFTVPQNVKEKIYLTQLIQLEAMREAAEHFRRNSHRCHGSLYWQLNDIWSSASWAALDCNVSRKALMYASKHFYENIHISAAKQKNKIEIHISNDLNEAFEGKLAVEKMNIANGVSTELERMKIFVNPLSSKCVLSIEKDDIKAKNEILIMRVYVQNGELVSENREIFTKNNKLSLKKANITCILKEENENQYISVTADNYARYVFIDLPGVKLSDNFFDLCKYETKLIKVESQAEIKSDVSAFSLYDVLVNTDRKSDIKAMLVETFKPMALANRISRYFEK